MKVAAYQAPLLAAGSREAIGLIQERVAWCESEGVSILCCPEAILGGLADYIEDSVRFAIRTDDGQLAKVLGPLKSDTVTSIVGFTERLIDGQLFNAAAVFHGGRVAGCPPRLGGEPHRGFAIRVTANFCPFFLLDSLHREPAFRPLRR